MGIKVPGSSPPKSKKCEKLKPGRGPGLSIALPSRGTPENMEAADVGYFIAAIVTTTSAHIIDDAVWGEGEEG